MGELCVISDPLQAMSSEKSGGGGGSPALLTAEDGADEDAGSNNNNNNTTSSQQSGTSSPLLDTAPLPQHDELTICPYCHQDFRKPRVLDCLHSICEDCIIAQIMKVEVRRDPRHHHAHFRGGYHGPGRAQPPPPPQAKSSPLECELESKTEQPKKTPPGIIRCPICSQDTNVGNDVRYVHQMLIDYVRWYSSAGPHNPSADQVCRACKSEQRAVAVCRQCRVELCLQCVQAHRDMRTFDGHEVVSQEQAKEEGLLTQMRVVPCRVHTQPLRFVCVTCEATACKVCCEQEHVGHGVVPISDAVVTTIKTEIQGNMDKLEERWNRMMDDQRAVGDRGVALQSQYEAAKEAMEEAFDGIEHALKDAKARLFKELEETRDMQEHRLEGVYKRYDQSETRVTDALSFGRRLVGGASGSELLVSRPKLLRQLANLLHELPTLHAVSQLMYKPPSRDVFQSAIDSLAGQVFMRPVPLPSDDLGHSAATGKTGVTVTQVTSSTGAATPTSLATAVAHHQQIPKPANGYVGRSSGPSATQSRDWWIQQQQQQQLQQQQQSAAAAGNPAANPTFPSAGQNKMDAAALAWAEATPRHVSPLSANNFAQFGASAVAAAAAAAGGGGGGPGVIGMERAKRAQSATSGSGADAFEWPPYATNPPDLPSPSPPKDLGATNAAAAAGIPSLLGSVAGSMAQPAPLPIGSRPMSSAMGGGVLNGGGAVRAAPAPPVNDLATLYAAMAAVAAAPGAAPPPNPNAFLFAQQQAAVQQQQQNISQLVALLSASGGKLPAMNPQQLSMLLKQYSLSSLGDIGLAAAASQLAAAGGQQIQAPLPPITRAVGQQSEMIVHRTFGAQGSNLRELNSPNGFTIGDNDSILIADTNNHRILVVDRENKSWRFNVVSGPDDGMLFLPRKVVRLRGDPTRYAVIDKGPDNRGRLQLFDMNGEFVSKVQLASALPSKGTMEMVTCMCAGSPMSIILVDSTNTIIELSLAKPQAPRVLAYFDGSQHIGEASDVKNRDRLLYVTDFKNHCVHRFSMEGAHLGAFGDSQRTPYPVGVDVTRTGDVLVADTHGNHLHIAVFAANGHFQQEFVHTGFKLTRCVGLRITSQGFVATLSKQSNSLVVFKTLVVPTHR